MTPDFLTKELKKIHFFGKIDSAKNTKKFYIYNNNMSPKWPVCRPIVKQANGKTSRTKLSTFFNKNIFKYCAPFCNEVAKIHLQ